MKKRLAELGGDRGRLQFIESIRCNGRAALRKYGRGDARASGIEHTGG
jgi:hypothetical protein